MLGDLHLAALVAHPATIGIVVIALVSWAFLSGRSLWRGTGLLVRSLEEATRAIERSPDEAAFASDYEAVTEQLKEDPIISGPWSEFKHSLVARHEPFPHYRSTTRVATWFNIDLLRSPTLGLDLRYHTALPNLLVGAGLLFTFIGLAFALNSASGVVSGEAAARTSALTTLLGTASFKFVTSLVGLLLSIVYALVRKHCLKQVERALDAFGRALESRVPIITLEELQQEANDILRQQADRLETFSTDLAVNIGQAFDRTFDARLGEHIQPLREAMERLAGGMSSRNEDAMGQMLDGFLQRLQGGAGDRMQDVAASLERLSGRLDGLQSGLGEAATRMAQSADTMAARMGEGAEAALSRITDQMSGLADTLRSVADETRGAGAQAGRELAERLMAAAGGFEEAARSMTKALAQAAEDSRVRMGQQSEESAARLARQFEAVVGELRGLAEHSREAGTDAIQAVAERIGGAAAGFEATAAKVAEALERAASDTGGALGRGAEQAVERIAEATEGMRDEMRGLIQEFKGAAISAGEALQKSGTAGAEAVGASLNGAGEVVAVALARASEALTGAGQAAGAALQQGGEAAGTRLEQAGSGFGGRAENLAQQVAALTTATNGIVLRLSEFEHAAEKAAQPLTASATDLRAASAAARAAVEPLGQAAQAVARATDQIAGAGQRLEGTQAAAGRLAENLAQAVGRFEGVDQDLARTLAELQRGLQGFTEQVAKTVKQTDDNLGKAAGQLGNAVKDLEAVLEPLVDAMPTRPHGGAPAGNGSGARKP